MISIGFITGNFIKNLYCIPRPPPPVVRIRENDNDDYSFPSTHAVQSVSIPLWIIYYNFFQNENPNTLLLVLSVCLACILSFCISLSRIYLGAHTLQDVIAGIAIGFIISLFYCPLTDYFEKILTKGRVEVQIMIFLLCIVLILLHPVEVFIKNRTSKFHISISQNGYITSSGLIGVGMGTGVGSWIFPDSYNTIVPLKNILNIFQRYIIGSICCIIIYIYSKKIVTSFLLKMWEVLNIPLFNPPYHYLLSEKDHELYKQKRKNLPYKFPLNILIGSGFQVMPAVKFIQYGSLAFMIMAGCPLIYAALGL